MSLKPPVSCYDPWYDFKSVESCYRILKKKKIGWLSNEYGTEIQISKQEQMSVIVTRILNACHN